ncbi:sulfatase-like hydrolase/transferase [Ruegeria lacuscaerulensis]|uniref:sulfatase-like hydrolase/transferase n=2 Tax=Ruegeria lacuscaerulensis TaxID=55218 RepID=UPI001481405E|nr:sulfatase-like hydrolase/transferase [Ruegeria lacuscaerulensis]
MRLSFALVLGALLVFCALVLPNHPGTMNWSAVNRWPLELPVILLFMIAFGRIPGVASILAALLIAASLMKLADYATFTAYNRTFNPIVDTFLIEAGFGLLQDSVGRPLAIAMAVTGGALVAIYFVLLRFGLKAWGSLSPPVWAKTAAVLGIMITGSWAVADAGHHLKYWRFDQSPPGTAWTSRLVFKRGTEMQATVDDLSVFRREARADPMRQAQGLLDRLSGRDVLLIWIESYGRASFDNPLYSETHLPTLQSAETALTQAGLSVKSGWLTSPTAGGESWLAHGALSTGLWTSDNGRYNAMLVSNRKWLFHYARDAGYRTAAIMPAITLAWPESAVMGFDHIFAAADIPYRGKRFGWVTMPDQFTLATYQDLLPPDPRPDFIQVALISSHAPWTPIPQMIRDQDLGDGTVFTPMAEQGPPARELWKDHDDVRDAYRRAVDYSLQAVFSHVAKLGKQAPLVIVAGDHQAAGFVAGSDNRDVPIHVIGPTDVLSLINHWGWADGLAPAADGPVRRMDTFRDDFLLAFTSSGQLAGEPR